MLSAQDAQAYTNLELGVALPDGADGAGHAFYVTVARAPTAGHQADPLGSRGRRPRRFVRRLLRADPVVREHAGLRAPALGTV